MALIKRQQLRLLDTTRSCVCVCVCVCDRERERTRRDFNITVVLRIVQLEMRTGKGKMNHFEYCKHGYWPR
jgi:hypothetical protein